MFNDTRGYPQLMADFGYPYPPDFSGTRHSNDRKKGHRNKYESGNAGELIKNKSNNCLIA